MGRGLAGIPAQWSERRCSHLQHRGVREVLLHGLGLIPLCNTAEAHASPAPSQAMCPRATLAGDHRIRSLQIVGGSLPCHAYQVAQAATAHTGAHILRWPAPSQHARPPEAGGIRTGFCRMCTRPVGSASAEARCPGQRRHRGGSAVTSSPLCVPAESEPGNRRCRGMNGGSEHAAWCSSATPTAEPR